MDAQTISWIKSILANDEASSDEEMLEHFVKEGGLDPEEAAQWAALRPRYRVEVFCDAEPEGYKAKEIVESWEGPQGDTYAITKYLTSEVAQYGKLYLVGVWDKSLSVLVPLGVPAEDLSSSFDTLDEAQDYLLRCVVEQYQDPDIWISLLKPTHTKSNE